MSSSNRIMHRAVVGAVVLSSVLACTAGRPAAKSLTQESLSAGDRIVVDGVEYTLALDALGIVLNPGEEHKKTILEEIRARGSEEYAARLLVAFVEKSTRSQLSATARHLERAFPQSVAAAGLVLHREGDQRPDVLGKRFVVVARPGVDEVALNDRVTSMGGVVVRRRHWDPQQYVVDALETDAQALADLLTKVPEVLDVKVRPLLLIEDQWRGDPLLGNQWHHENNASTGLAVDADIDAGLAWGLWPSGIEPGTGIVIAVVEQSGFEPEHDDYDDNLWTNPGEGKIANGSDDDGNFLKDDIRGWNFASNSSTFTIIDYHGTAVAGVAAAERGIDSSGGCGTCPGCHLLLLQCSPNFTDAEDAIRYATKKGVDIINMSWAVQEVDECLSAALRDASAQGIVLVAAMRNDVNIDESAVSSLAAHSNVLAVGGSDFMDQRAPSSYGRCLDVLAPRDGGLGSSLARITTTDLVGGQGLNPPSPTSPCNECSDSNFTLCFTGNSAATPIVSGAAALVISAAARNSIALEPQQVENLLRDTADRVDSPIGDYRSVNGRSWVWKGVKNPRGIAIVWPTSTHGYGRINAYEAVRVVAPAPYGRAGVDVFFRDQDLDWGNTQQRSGRSFGPPGDYLGHWESADIKVDAPPFQTAPTSAREFEQLVDENPLENEHNTVWIRVRNRGPLAAEEIRVRLYWTFAGAGLPMLPKDFWTNEHASSSQWHSLGVQRIRSLAYCGSSVAGTVDDVAALVSFDFLAPSIQFGIPDATHYCLFAELDAENDPVNPRWRLSKVLAPDDITPWDNNVTHKNLQVMVSKLHGLSSMSLQMNNPFPDRASFRLRTRIPEEWQLEVEPASVLTAWEAQPEEQIQVSLRLLTPPGAQGEARFVQERLVAIEEGGQDSTEGAPEGFHWIPFGGRTLRVLARAEEGD